MFYKQSAIKDGDYYTFLYVPYLDDFTLNVVLEDSTQDIEYSETSNGFIYINVSDIIREYPTVKQITFTVGREVYDINIWFQNKDYSQRFLDYERPESTYDLFVLDDID